MLKNKLIEFLIIDCELDFNFISDLEYNIDKIEDLDKYIKDMIRAKTYCHDLKLFIKFLNGIIKDSSNLCNYTIRQAYRKIDSVNFFLIYN